MRQRNANINVAEDTQIIKISGAKRNPYVSYYPWTQNLQTTEVSTLKATKQHRQTTFPWWTNLQVNSSLDNFLWCSWKLNVSIVLKSCFRTSFDKDLISFLYLLVGHPFLSMGGLIGIFFARKHFQMHFTLKILTASRSSYCRTKTQISDETWIYWDKRKSVIK